MTENQAPSFEDLNKEFSFAPPEEEKSEDTKEFSFDSAPPSEDVLVEKEELITESKKEKEVITQLKVETSFYGDLIKKKLEKGLWEDAVVKYKVEGEEKETKISEFENATEDDYLQFEEDQKALKEQDLKDKYLSVDNVTPEKKLILEIITNGGDLKQIFQNESQLKKPFDEADGWDLDNEKHQESVVYQHYLSLGNTPNKAAILVDVDKKEMTLDSIAKEVVEYHQKSFTDNLNKINNQLIEDNKIEAENTKRYSQDLAKIYKEQGVPDIDAKKYISSAIKEIDGQFEADVIYENIMKDPVQAAELIFFMKDREKYKRAQGIQTKVEQNLKVFRTIDRIPKTTDPKEQQIEKETRFSFSV
jgi:polyhydroxyalkanoate synthesis regulator phasin